MTLFELKELLLWKYEQSRGEKPTGVYTGERLLYLLQRQSFIYFDKPLFQTPITVDSKGRVKIDMSTDENVDDDTVNELSGQDFLALTHSELGLHTLMMGEISVKNAINKAKNDDFAELSMNDIIMDAKLIRRRMVGLHRFNEHKRLSDKIKKIALKSDV